MIYIGDGFGAGNENACVFTSNGSPIGWGKDRPERFLLESTYRRIPVKEWWPGP